MLCSSPEVKWNEPFLWLYGALYIGLVFKNVLNWFVHSQPDSTSMTIMVVRKTGGDDQRELYCTAIYVQNDLLHILQVLTLWLGYDKENVQECENIIMMKQAKQM